MENADTVIRRHIAARRFAKLRHGNAGLNEQNGAIRHPKTLETGT
jgi:hypothetical protein